MGMNGPSEARRLIGVRIAVDAARKPTAIVFAVFAGWPVLAGAFLARRFAP
jgi:hypothetical protein